MELQEGVMVMAPRSKRGRGGILRGGDVKQRVPHRKGGCSIHNTEFNTYVGSKPSYRTALWPRTFVENLPDFSRI